MKNKKIIKICFVVMMLGIVLFPVLSFALTPGTGTASTMSMTTACGTAVKDIGNVICRIGFMLNKIVPILMTLGVIYLVYGIVQYVIGGDEEAKTKGRDRIIAGIIGLAIIVSIWGLVSLVVNGLGLDNQELTIINPTNIVDNNLQNTNSTSCYATYAGKSSPIVTDLITYATCVIGASVVPLLFTVAIVFFIWGVVQMLINGDDEEKRSKGKQFMIWGIVALTVMVSVWGLVQILGNSFNIKTNFYPKVQS